MKITKLLSLESRPAQTLLARAKKVVLSYADRVKTPAELPIDGIVYENALGDVRPLEVDDVLVDEKGAMYVVAAGEDKVMHVTGDHELMQEAVYAFVARGIRVAKTDDGFAVINNDTFRQMLEGVGLNCTVVDEPFVPVPLPRPHAGGCGCGCGHHHHHDEGCGCGCHDHEHHHHDEEEGCSCGCGGHHHHDHEDECGCGCHDHEHHHHDEEEGCSCGCGGHHHHDHEDECGCGCHDHEHHHHDEEEGCSCGCGGHHHHDHEEECGCGHKH